MLIWSCGNESFGGRDIYEMSRFFRETDPTRLVHYEGVFHDRRYPDTSDMESQMYTPAADVAAFIEKPPGKAFIMSNTCMPWGIPAARWTVTPV